MHIIQPPLFDFEAFVAEKGNERLLMVVKALLGLDRITLRGIGKVTARSLLSLLVMLAAAVGMAQRHRLKELRLLVT